MPLQRPLNTHFVLERNEFRKASRLALRNLPAKVRWAGYVQCGLLIALMLAGAAYQPNGKIQPISVIILILVWLVFLTAGITSRAWAELRFAPMEGKEIWYEFYENGFRCGMPSAESQLSWPAISTIIETDTLFVIMNSGLLFYTIPKRALATDEVSSLQQLLSEKVTART
jgi:YcxB-like protein